MISNYGCAADSITNVHININPVAAFSFEDACQDTEILFANNSSSMEGAIVNQTWDINGIGGGNSDLGDTIYAISPGIVDKVKEVDYLTIYHKYNSNIIKVLYYHMYKPMVKEGQYVTKGQPIALIGNSDGAYFAHLHFEVMKDTTTFELFYGDPIGHLDPAILFPNFKSKKL